jgi:hypothetical protein
LKNGAGIPELTRFEEHFHDYKIVVYWGLNCESITCQGHVDSDKRVNLLFDNVTQYSHVVANLTWAMAKRYVCEGYNKGCKFCVVHTCEKKCNDCLVSPPFISAGIRIPCDLCSRHFRSQICFDNHKSKTPSKRKKKRASEFVSVVVSVARWSPKIRTNATDCSVTYYENTEVGHLCFMRPVNNVPESSEHVLYVFYDFETTQDTKRSDMTNEHVPNLVC